MAKHCSRTIGSDTGYPLTLYWISAVAVLAFAFGTSHASCEPGFEFLVESARATQEISILEVQPQSGLDGREEGQAVELRWTAFGQEFVMDLIGSPRVDGGLGPDPNPRRLFHGSWRDNEAQSVLFSRWKSGAWEGDIVRGEERYFVRVPCEQRENSSPPSKARIFLLDFPADKPCGNE